MRRMALVVVLVVIGGCGGDPKRDLLAPKTRCVVTGEGVSSTVFFVPIEERFDGVKGTSLVPGDTVRVVADLAAKSGQTNPKRPIGVTVESGQHKGAQGFVTREYLRPVK